MKSSVVGDFSQLEVVHGIGARFRIPCQLVSEAEKRELMQKINSMMAFAGAGRTKSESISLMFPPSSC
jgi:hypothetical protein